MKSMNLIIVTCCAAVLFALAPESLAHPAPPPAPPSAPTTGGALGGALLKRLGFYGMVLQSLGCMASLQGEINALDMYLMEIEELDGASSTVFEEVLGKIAAAGCDQPRVVEALTECLRPAAQEEIRLTELFTLLVRELSIGDAILGFCPFIGTGSPIWGQIRSVISVAQELRDLKEQELVCLSSVAANFENLKVSCDSASDSGADTPIETQ